jgi:outer membrane protein OmpA-like peptidoglycan-associated protein
MQLLNKNAKKKLLLVFLFINSYQLLFSQTKIHEVIYFKTNSFKLDSTSLAVLDNVVKQCCSDSIYFIKIFGYTDTTGESTYNEKLSEERANTVYNYLKTHRTFDAAKVYVEWLGESDDGYDLHFPEAHLQQRCVDILISLRKK